mmetsp:Transcript_6522/g.11346  ORF Transcript_6522/g.11346 Transcript_6522/m.11346 type:complete len:113 (+) Transcript_6522:514-852(+)
MSAFFDLADFDAAAAVGGGGMLEASRGAEVDVDALLVDVVVDVVVVTAGGGIELANNGFLEFIFFFFFFWKKKLVNSAFLSANGHFFSRLRFHIRRIVVAANLKPHLCFFFL